MSFLFLKFSEILTKSQNPTSQKKNTKKKNNNKKIQKKTQKNQTNKKTKTKQNQKIPPPKKTDFVSKLIISVLCLHTNLINLI